MKVYCILSDERAYLSKSPIMFSTVLKKMGIRGTYVPFKVAPENLGQAIQSVRILNIAGVNVTVPYKERVIPFLDVLSEGANVIGAVNTIVCKGDELKGYNTNAIGIMDALSDYGFEPEGKSALVFGTGGAAKAVIFILNWLRTETIYVTGRNLDKCRELVERFGGEAVALHDLAERRLPVHSVINATTVSSPEESPELARLVRDLTFDTCELVVDLNYGRAENFWQSVAAAQGIPFMDGLPALAFQARRTFALWTGMQVPPREFLAALNASNHPV
jgi:shikimate dehydrogenase